MNYQYFASLIFIIKELMMVPKKKEKWNKSLLKHAITRVKIQRKSN